MFLRRALSGAPVKVVSGTEVGPGQPGDVVFSTDGKHYAARPRRRLSNPISSPTARKASTIRGLALSGEWSTAPFCGIHGGRLESCLRGNYRRRPVSRSGGCRNGVLVGGVPRPGKRC